MSKTNKLLGYWMEKKGLEDPYLKYLDMTQSIGSGAKSPEDPYYDMLAAHEFNNSAQRPNLSDGLKKPSMVGGGVGGLMGGLASIPQFVRGRGSLLGRIGASALYAGGGALAGAATGATLKGSENMYDQHLVDEANKIENLYDAVGDGQNKANFVRDHYRDEYIKERLKELREMKVDKTDIE